MGAETISLRDYRESDLDEMIRVDEICFAADFRFDQAAMSAFASARNAAAVVAETSVGAMAGFVIVHLERGPGGSRGYIVTLDVLPEYRRGGLGARLIGEIERRVVVAGARWMDLHVFAGNDSAVRFYERMGTSGWEECSGFMEPRVSMLLYTVRGFRTALKAGPPPLTKDDNEHW